MMKSQLAAVILCIYSTAGFADNPLIRDIGMSDPHIRVFHDTIYLFCGHDDNPADQTWVMKEWRIFSSTDLLQWTLEEVISPADNYMDDTSQNCWAGDAATRNEKYYFYFSDGKRGIGVMTADSPEGPYIDALGGPLVSPMHDPTIFVDNDPDQTPYIVYGDKKGSYHIGKLNEDMISLKESPRSIAIYGKEWENAPSWMDKNYLFKYQNRYYVSWGRDYAVSSNVYGPYECMGAVGFGHNLNEFAHGSFFWWKGQFYHIWCYYLRPGYKYRESIISYCHFSDEGQIITDTDFLDKHFHTGVGQYSASWPEIQAEWFYEKSDEIKKRECPEGGFEIISDTDGDWIRYANMLFDQECDQFTARIANSGKAGTLEIVLDSLKGPVAGRLSVPNTGKSLHYKSISCKIAIPEGRRDIYLRFTGEKGILLNLDWFRFQYPSISSAD